MTRPDKWLIIKFKDSFRVFATWSGGYLSSDCWRINSGIKEVKEESNRWIFIGESGSEYSCSKNSYGTTAYGGSILNSLGDDVEILDCPKEFIKNNITNQ